MAYKKKQINTNLLNEPKTIYPYQFNIEPFKILNDNDLNQLISLYQLYTNELFDKHPSQLNGYFELGRTYPNYKNIVELCKFIIKLNDNTDNMEISKKVLMALGYKHLTGL